MSIHPHPPRAAFGPRAPYARVFRRLVGRRWGRPFYQWRFRILGVNGEPLASAGKLNSKQAVSDAIWLINPALPVVWP